MKEWNFKFLKWKYFFLTILKSKGMISLDTICFEFDSVCTGALLFGIVASSSHTRLPLHHRMPVSMSTWVVFNECHMKKRRGERDENKLPFVTYVVYVYVPQLQCYSLWYWLDCHMLAESHLLQNHLGSNPAVFKNHHFQSFSLNQFKKSHSRNMYNF